MLDALAMIQQYISSGRDAFFSSPALRDAVIRQFTIMGEAAKRLSPGLRSGHPEVPWRDLAGLRDVLVHDYMSINLPAIWDMAEIRLPALRQQIQQILQALDAAQ